MRFFSTQIPTRVSTLAGKSIAKRAVPCYSGHTSTTIVASTTKLLPPPLPSTTRPLQFNTKRHLTSTIQSPKIMPTDTQNCYKFIFYAPTSDLEKCKEAVFTTGAGTFPGGKYRKCAFHTTGTGQFLPSEDANPAIGGAGAIEKVEEAKVEVLCFGREVMRRAVEELVKAHPYEEVAYEVYKLEDI